MYTSLAVGDLVDVTAEVQEWYGLTRLNDPIAVEVVSSGHSLSPLVVTTGALGTACTHSGKAYMGLLVTVLHVVLGQPDQWGQLRINDGSGEAEVEDDGVIDAGARLRELIGADDIAGETVASITGTVSHTLVSTSAEADAIRRWRHLLIAIRRTEEMAQSAASEDGAPGTS